MPRKCIVYGCTSNKGKAATYIPVFSFPANEELLKKWKDVLGLKSAPSAYNAVCLRHFEESDVRTTEHASSSGIRYKKFLNKGSIPSKNLNTPKNEKETLKNPKTCSIYAEPTSNRSHLKRSIRRNSLVENAIQGKDPLQKRNTTVTSEDNSDYEDHYLSEKKCEDISDILITNLQLHHLKQEHLKHKIKFERFKTTSVEQEQQMFPIIHSLQKFNEGNRINFDKNPIFWNIEEISIFLELYTNSEELIEKFTVEKMNGKAMLNTTPELLYKYFSLSEESSENLGNLFLRLKNETITKFCQRALQRK